MPTDRKQEADRAVEACRAAIDQMVAKKKKLSVAAKLFVPSAAASEFVMPGGGSMGAIAGAGDHFDNGPPEAVSLRQQVQLGSALDGVDSTSLPPQIELDLWKQ